MKGNVVKCVGIGVVLFILVGFVQSDTSGSGTLNFESRFAIQKTIEKIYYNHRSWPKENPSPKPAFENLVPPSIIEEKVEESIQKSVLLQKSWHETIDGTRLQAELDRIITQTRDPELLQELFAALNNDPYLIAECLVRPVLVERLIKNRYYADNRIHGELKEEVLSFQKKFDGKNPNRPDDVQYQVIRARIRTKKDKINLANDNYIALEKEEFGTLLTHYPENKKTLKFEELRESFCLFQLLERSGDRMTGAVFVFPKRPFEQWFADQVRTLDVSNFQDTNPYSYRLNSIKSSTPEFKPDTWYSEEHPPLSRYLHTAVWTGAEMIVWGGTEDDSMNLAMNSGARYNPTLDQWTATSMIDVPDARFNHSAIWTGSEMIIWGGEHTTELNSGGRYNPVLDRWLDTSSSGDVPSNRTQHSAVWTGSEMIIWGGLPDGLDTGSRYIPTLNQWTTITMTNAPPGRFAHAAVWTGSEMIIWGGDAGGDDQSGARYKPNTDTWITMTTLNAPEWRRFFSAVWTGSEMIVFGGKLSLTIADVGGRYDPFNDSWTSLPQHLSFEATDVPQYFETSTSSDITITTDHGLLYDVEVIVSITHPCVSELTINLHHPDGTIITLSDQNDGCSADYDTTHFDDEAITPISSGTAPFNGSYQPDESLGNLDDENSIGTWTLEVIDNQTGSNHGTLTDWTLLLKPSTLLRRNHTAIWTGSEMICWGGYFGNSIDLQSGIRFNPDDNTYSDISLVNAPVRRGNHVAVWTGSEMIVWGGTQYILGGSIPLLNSGGRYSPSLDAWTALNVDNLSESRLGHSAVWTGTEMIIWGGFGNNENPIYYQTGKLYNPALNAVQETTLTNVPDGRNYHAALWNGTEMIIWGGYDGDDYLKSGGIYNYAGDSWQSTNIVDAPDERRGCSAVWTGTEMIIWSGYRLGDYLTSGKRYDPVSDSWTAMTEVNVPLGRQDHTALWTGEEMIIWGGFGDDLGDGSYYNTGARYTPPYNLNPEAWVTTSIDNVPDERTFHSAIWTGTEMVIWGGSNMATGYLNSGARYVVDDNPANDTWIDLPTENAPNARSNHTVIWTGQEMILWGGYNSDSSSGLLDSGGRFSLDTLLWDSTPLSDAPPARVSHTAVWTGQEMIIWGGTPNYSFGIFYPNTLPSSQPDIMNTDDTVVIGESLPLRLSHQLPVSWWDDVEGAENWTGQDDWHVINGQDCSGVNDFVSPAHAWYFGNSSGCEYTGAMGTYTLVTTSPITIMPDSTSDPLLTFRYFLDTDYLKADSAFVDVQLNSGAWVRLATDISHWSSTADGVRLDDSCTDWQGVSVNLIKDGLYSSIPIDSELHIRFSFYRDGNKDYGIGWILDDIGVGQPSGDGSNPETTNPYHDRWDRATFEWDIQDNGSIEYSSGVTPVWTINESDLVDYGIGSPGVYDLRLYVADSLSYAASDVVTLTVTDGIPPTVTVLDPDGGESWSYSESDTVRTNNLIVWESDDNFTLTRTKLSYRTVSEVSTEPVIAKYHLQFEAPFCQQLGPECDSGTLLISTGNYSGEQEVNEPNTIQSSCLDGWSGLYQLDESIEQLRIYTLDGTALASGKTVRIEATVWAYDTYTSDRLDLYYTTDIASPSWTWLTTLTPTKDDLNILTYDYVLPAGNLQAIRGQFRYLGTGGPGNECFESGYTDHDDLIFVVNENLWSCIADSAGTDCAAGSLSGDATSYLWEMPTIDEAGFGGQIFPTAQAQVKVDVWDQSDNNTNDASNNNFYIIQPTTSAIKTLILWDSTRIESLYGLAEKNNLAVKLQELSNHNKILGAVLDLSSVSAVQSAYAAWDDCYDGDGCGTADPIDRANAVAAAIHTYLFAEPGGQVVDTYTNVAYLILVGDDIQIPFYRMNDGTSIYPEGDYPSESGLDTDSRVGSAIAASYFLTDSFYAEVDPEDSYLSSNEYVYIEDFALGRLVETPSQISGVIDTFLAYDGEVDLSSAGDEILVTGFDFFYDSAADIKDTYAGSPYNKTTDCLLDDPDRSGTVNPCDDMPFTPHNLKSQVFSSPPHRVMNINTHADHYNWATSAGSPSYLSTQEMADVGESLDGTIIYSSGCHSGLSVPPDDSHPLDLAELMARKKVLGYLANTGYGWGLRYGKGLTERLMELITTEILTNQSISIGRTLSTAKRTYYHQEKRYDVFDEKILHELTLFGIPNTIIISSVEPEKKASLPKPTGPDRGCADGICLQKKLTQNTKDLPSELTELELNFTFGSGNYSHVETDDGQYFLLNDKNSNEVGDALQPLFVYDSHLSGIESRSVLMTGGSYFEQSVIPSFNPVIAVPRSTNFDYGEGPLPKSSLFSPTIRVSSSTGGYSATKALDTDGLATLVVHTGYLTDNNVEYLFDEMQFVQYYSNSSDTVPPSITEPAPEGFHSGSGLDWDFVIHVTDSSGVFRVLVTYNDTFDNTWKSLELTFNRTTNNWEGNLSIRGTISYYVQALDRAGNLSILSDSGDDLDGSVDKTPYGSQWVGPRLFTIEVADNDYGDGTGDGLPDIWEDMYPCVDSTNPNDAGSRDFTCDSGPDPLTDPDNDCLSNIQELISGTDPCNPDSDGGGDNDGSEVRNEKDPGNGLDDSIVTITIIPTGIVDELRLEWHDNVSNSPCPAGPTMGENDEIDGPYYVYKASEPTFSSPTLVDIQDDGENCITDSAATGDVLYYNILNHEL